MNQQQIQDSIVQEQVVRHAAKNAIIDRLQAENAALKADNELLRSLSFRDERDSLKEQVAQLKELNENHAFNAKYFKAGSETLQSKSAALELEMKEISDRAFETLNRTPTVYYQGLKNIMERACAALAAAKGEK